MSADNSMVAVTAKNSSDYLRLTMAVVSCELNSMLLSPRTDRTDAALVGQDLFPLI